MDTKSFISDFKLINKELFLHSLRLLLVLQVWMFKKSLWLFLALSTFILFSPYIIGQDNFISINKLNWISYLDWYGFLIYLQEEVSANIDPWWVITICTIFFLGATLIYWKFGMNILKSTDEDCLRELVEMGHIIRSIPINLYDKLKNSDKRKLLAYRMDHINKDFLVMPDDEPIDDTDKAYHLKLMQDQVESDETKTVLKLIIDHMHTHYPTSTQEDNPVSIAEHKFAIHMYNTLTVLWHTVKIVAAYENKNNSKREDLIIEIQNSNIQILEGTTGELCFPICDTTKGEGVTFVVTEDFIRMPHDMQEVAFFMGLMYLLPAKWARPVYIRLNQLMQSNSSFWKTCLFVVWRRSKAMVKHLRFLSRAHAMKNYAYQNAAVTKCFSAQESDIRTKQKTNEKFSVEDQLTPNIADLFIARAKGLSINFNGYPKWIKPLLSYKVKDISPRRQKRSAHLVQKNSVYWQNNSQQQVNASNFGNGQNNFNNQPPNYNDQNGGNNENNNNNQEQDTALTPFKGIKDLFGFVKGWFGRKPAPQTNRG